MTTKLSATFSSRESADNALTRMRRDGIEFSIDRFFVESGNNLNACSKLSVEPGNNPNAYNETSYNVPLRHYTETFSTPPLFSPEAYPEVFADLSGYIGLNIGIDGNMGGSVELRVRGEQFERARAILIGFQAKDVKVIG